MTSAYPAIFHREEDGYSVTFPDLPGCISEGDNMPDAITQAQEALGGYLFSLQERGLAIPPASRIQDVPIDDDDFPSMIAADTLAFAPRMKSVKKTLTIPQWLNDQAENHNVNFSQVLQKALIEHLSL